MERRRHGFLISLSLAIAGLALGATAWGALVVPTEIQQPGERHGPVATVSSSEQ